MLSCDLGSIIFCARQQTRLAERAGQKIALQRQLSDLGVPGLYTDIQLQLSLGSLSEHTSRPFEKLVTPLLHLVRMRVEFVRQFNQRLLALDRSNCRFRLECRAVVPARSSSHGLLLARSIVLLLRGKST